LERKPSYRACMSASAELLVNPLITFLCNPQFYELPKPENCTTLCFYMFCAYDV